MKKILFGVSLLILITACQKDVSDGSTTPILKTDSASLSLSENVGARDSFNIQSNILWNITILPASADWLQVSVESDSGNLKVFVTVVRNNTDDTARKATLIVAAVNNSSVLPVNIAVTQEKPGATARNAYGGSEEDLLYDAEVTPDGGYIAVGTTASNDGDISGLHGSFEDAWIIKVDANGNKVWQKILGGTGRDFGSSIAKTPDGNYIVVAAKDLGDASNAGQHEGSWIIKLKDNGDIIWDKVIAGISEGSFQVIEPANGGGYVLAGSNSGTNNSCWVVKIDENGNKVWEKLVGGMWWDGASDIERASDGGYIVIGSSQSTDGDIVGNHGSYDMVVYKLDENGNKVWFKCFGGTGDEGAGSILKTSDGGYLIAGNSNSNDGDVSGNHGGYDVWVLKIDAGGNKVWQKTYGGSGGDGGSHIIPASGGGFIIAAGTASVDGDVTTVKGNSDAWIVKIDANGNKVWQKTLGGTDDDGIFVILEKSAGNYVGVGTTWSNDGDVVGYKADFDGWIIRFKQ